ncbi:MAG: hypothetical protein IT368_16825, partial [Candidatus Hydrogenedentes bacterium]|nr:hypothetical protein [Candidatus Hydrogenedentota bacterium]
MGRPGRSWLELRGTILVYHRDSWLASSSLFVPIEWAVIRQSRQLDVRRLWRGILGLMAAFVLMLPVLVILRVLPPLTAVDIVLGVALGALLVLSLGIGLVSLTQFMRPRQVTAIQVSADGFRPEITFWHAPGKHAELDDLVERLRSLRSRI